MKQYVYEYDYPIANLDYEYMDYILIHGKIIIIFFILLSFNFMIHKLGNGILI